MIIYSSAVSCVTDIYLIVSSNNMCPLAIICGLGVNIKVYISALSLQVVAWLYDRAGIYISDKIIGGFSLSSDTVSI